MLAHYLRRLFVIVLLVLFLISCGGGGGDSSTVDNSPKLTSVSLWSVDEDNNNWEKCSEFAEGDYANVRIYYTDPNRDIAQFEVDIYNPEGAFNPQQESVIEIQGDLNYSDGAYASLLDPVMVTGPAGNCRIEFVAIDSDGNESNILTKYYTISHSVEIELRITGVPAGTMIDRFDLALEYDETKLEYRDYEKGSLILGIAGYVHEGEGSLRFARSTFADEFDASVDAALLTYYFKAMGTYQPVESDFKVVSFRAEHIYRTYDDINADNITMTMKITE